MSVQRFATIDLGTNTALLLIAERHGQDFVPVFERAEITRLGEGVDAERRLLPVAMQRSARMLAEYAEKAREYGVRQENLIAVSTSAARDALNRDELIEMVKSEAGIGLTVIPGEEEARLTWIGATADMPAEEGQELCVFDIGGGSSELIFGTKEGGIRTRRSFDVGSVRMTERFLKGDPPTAEERRTLFAHLKAVFSPVREMFSSDDGARAFPAFIGVAGTVTTLFTLIHGIEPYDAERVHGERMDVYELSVLLDKLFSLSVEERKQLRGMEPKRADVIAAGGAVLLSAMEEVGVSHLTVSDRGLRWGLLRDRFAARS